MPGLVALDLAGVDDPLMTARVLASRMVAIFIYVFYSGKGRSAGGMFVGGDIFVVVTSL